MGGRTVFPNLKGANIISLSLEWALIPLLLGLEHNRCRYRNLKVK